MPRGTGVGQSEGRTPGKHDLLGRVVGREVAVAQREPRFGALAWYDLCAGDGAATFGRDWIRSCSPGILAHHGRYVSLTKPLTIHLYEKARATHATLLDNLARELQDPELGYERLAEDHWRFRQTDLFVHHAEAATATVDHVSGRTAVMLVNDPNNVDQWACPAGLLADLQCRSDYVLMMSTMGCNPGSLKRLSWEKREKWYEHARAQARARASWHDVYLCAIERDDAQWAYLITAPRKWNGKVEEDARTAFGNHGLGLEGYWLNRDGEGFRRLIDVLFKTKNERKQGEGP